MQVRYVGFLFIGHLSLSLYINACITWIRCCEYALLILEYWADAPEIQRSADLYEDLIRCCVADAMSEVGYCLFDIALFDMVGSLYAILRCYII